jgi:hypothetical protein
MLQPQALQGQVQLLLPLQVLRLLLLLQVLRRLLLLQVWLSLLQARQTLHERQKRI